jgi:hypothetical protein
MLLLGDDLLLLVLRWLPAPALARCAAASRRFGICEMAETPAANLVERAAALALAAPLGRWAWPVAAREGESALARLWLCERQRPMGGALAAGVAAGAGGHSCAVARDGRLLTCGRGGSGQLGHGETSPGR